VCVLQQPIRLFVHHATVMSCVITPVYLEPLTQKMKKEFHDSNIQPFKYDRWCPAPTTTSINECASNSRVSAALLKRRTNPALPIAVVYYFFDSNDTVMVVLYIARRIDHDPDWVLQQILCAMLRHFDAIFVSGDKLALEEAFMSPLWCDAVLEEWRKVWQHFKKEAYAHPAFGARSRLRGCRSMPCPALIKCNDGKPNPSPPVSRKKMSGV